MDVRGKGIIAAAVLLFFCSTVFFVKSNPAFALSGILVDEKELGEICISQISPTARIDGEDEKFNETDNKKESAKISDTKEEQTNIEEDKNITLSDEPLVIIYHTHSSESYRPYTESNYHRAEEEGTVRDVGNVLEAELKKQGINVVHDKTIHDRPSYNESYSRSLNTIQSLVKKYPSAVYIIDLHRDAAAASAAEGKYIEIDGKRTAKFSLVVGRANENYVELYDFAKKVSGKAESMYAGFGGAIIEKNYNYNEYVSNKALLLEVGNNKNTIEEARECGRHFAGVLASVIKEEQ